MLFFPPPRRESFQTSRQRVMEEEGRVVSPEAIQQPCPDTVTVRRNPHRRARPTPKAGLPSSLKPGLLDVPSFPIEDVLAINLPQNSNPPPTPSPIGDSTSESLKVYLRIRPISINRDSVKCDASSKYREKKRGARSPKKRHAVVKKTSEICVIAASASSVTLSPPKDLQEAKRIKAEVFEGFSHVFRADSSQGEVYENMVKPLVEDFLKGTSGMLAALGPSGSGKTYTVFGSPRDPGIVPLALTEIFGQTNGNIDNFHRSFYLSMFQIYSERGKGEKVFDLSSGAELSMQQSTIKGLEEVVITDIGHAESLIASGMLKRATAMTNSNSQSSRSQCITIIRNVVARHDEVDIPLNTANLTFIDLAGAEREKKTGNQGERLLESNFINNTSMVFGLCLRSLLEHQKNPKRPLQKHFQSSLLTRYLRDYLEGKKRMTLLLTIKPGGEDYLDSSHLLRQAAPFMKIKFNNAEESSALVCNKRQITALPRTEKVKRAKVSKTEVSVAEEEKGNSTKAADGKTEDQLMLHFARAMWSVLNQCKKKLQVAESEIENLRENLANEKTRILDLEKELKNLKASCTCINRKPTEVPSTQTDANSESDAGASPEENKPSSSESSDEVEGKVHSCLLQIAECSKMQSECHSTFRQFDDIKRAGGVNSTPLHTHDHLDPNNRAEDRIVLIRNESVREPVDLSNSSVSPNKIFCKQDGQYVEIKDEQPCGDDSQGDLEDSKLGNSCNKANLKDTMSSFQPHALLGKDSSWTIELHDLQSDVDEVSSDSPAVISKDVTPTEAFSSVKDPETVQELDSSCQFQNLEKPRRNSTRSPDKVFDKQGKQQSIATEDEHPRGNEDSKGVFEDSTQDNSFSREILKDRVCYSQPHTLLRKDSCSTVELDDLLSDSDEVSSDLPAATNKEVTSTEASSFSKEPEAVTKSNSSCQLPNLEKPRRRRLLPASSVLLRNMSYWDLGDEEEKPKGNKGGKKKDAGEEPRTKGNANLLKLLKGSLRL